MKELNYDEVLLLIDIITSFIQKNKFPKKCGQHFWESKRIFTITIF